MNETRDITSPLSDATRHDRRAMLLVSILLVAVVFGHVRPTQIQQLGITLESSEQLILILLMLAIQGYLLISFFYAAKAEQQAWQLLSWQTERTYLSAVNELEKHLLSSQPTRIDEVQELTRQVDVILEGLQPYVSHETEMEQFKINLATLVLDETKAVDIFERPDGLAVVRQPDGGIELQQTVAQRMTSLSRILSRARADVVKSRRVFYANLRVAFHLPIAIGGIVFFAVVIDLVALFVPFDPSPLLNVLHAPALLMLRKILAWIVVLLLLVGGVPVLVAIYQRLRATHK